MKKKVKKMAKVDLEKDDSPWGFKPHKYECPICGGDRVVHRSKIDQPYAVTDNKVCHTTYKCVLCYSTSTHGIPISSEYAEELIERRGGTDVYVPWSENHQNTKETYLGNFTEKQQEIVEQRLRKLGYF